MSDSEGGGGGAAADDGWNWEADIETDPSGSFGEAAPEVSQLALHLFISSSTFKSVKRFDFPFFL